MSIKARLKHYKNLIYCKLNPIGYARSIGVKVGNNVRIYGAHPNMFSTEPWLITIGNNVHIANGTQFLTHDGGTLVTNKEVPGFVITGRITIGNNVYIGMRTMILPGTSIGDRCIIGAGSIVTKDIPPSSVAVGVPAKITRSVDSYIDKLHDIIDGKDDKYFSDLDYMHSLNPNRDKK